MKRNLYTLMAAFVVLFSQYAYCGTYGGGLGTAAEPYLISTAEQMQEIGANEADWGKHFMLTENIDLSAYTGTSYNIIGNDTTAFSGVFDGSGHTVTNFNMDALGINCVGMFGKVGQGGMIHDLGLVNVIIAGGPSTGGLAGRLMYGTITRCYVTGTVEGSSFVGGLVGDNLGGKIADCYVNGHVSGVDNVGGIVGRNGSYNYSTNSLIHRSYSEGSVQGELYVGGLVGRGYEIFQCHSNSEVMGVNKVGGLIGDSLALVKQCYSTGNVSGDKYVGGLIGNAGTWVVQCFSTGDVTGQYRYVGGLVGQADSQVFESYSVGTVATSGRDISPFVGDFNYGDVSVECFYNTETTSPGWNNEGIGLTTRQLQEGWVYFLSGWDGSVWTIDEGNEYPRFAWEDTEDPSIADYQFPLAGSGTEQDPFLVYATTDLEYMETLAMFSDEKHLKLMSDLDMAGISHSPIGNYYSKFSGIFNGNNHTISNLTLSFGDNAYVGFFGCVGQNGKISNLNLKNVSISASGHVGGLAGCNEGDVLHCSVTGSIAATDYYAGGIVGENGGQIVRCHVSGVVSGTHYIGGVAGANKDSGHISECCSIGTVNGTKSGIGGLVGYNDANVSQCYSNCQINSIDDLAHIAPSDTGGLAGCNGPDGTIMQCYSTGDVNGFSSAGGLVGNNNQGAIANCYSTGIARGYKYGNNVAGLLARDFNGTITNCFWDTQTSGLTYSLGGTGLTTEQMQRADTYSFAGWGSYIWTIDNGHGYPHLWWEETGDPFLGELPSPLEGSGTEADPYKIQTAADLHLLSLSHNFPLWNKHFILTAEIDLTGVEMDPIGLYGINSFTGVFDGAGHTISNLTQNLPDVRYVGLFAVLDSEGIVKDLDLQDVQVTGKSNVGALVGVVRYGVVSRCSSSGVVITTDNSDAKSGGLAGETSYSVFSECYSTCTINSNGNQIGGLVGKSHEATYQDCYHTGEINGRSSVGGFLGYSQFDDIRMCYHTGIVNASSSVGGLVGYSRSMITSCYTSGKVNSFKDGSNYNGGLVGINLDGTISECFSAADVTSAGSVAGGLVGSNRNSVMNSFCMGSIVASDTVGGLIGSNSKSVVNCYSTSSVSGSIAGGLIARISGFTPSVTHSFWDINTSETSTSAGGTGKTTAHMQDIDTFLNAAWDFVGETANGIEDIWYLPGCGYPALSWQPVGLVPDVTGLLESDAVSQITSAGPIAVVNTVHSEVVPSGYVVSQEPSVGCEAAVVTIIVSIGVSDDLQERIDAAADGDTLTVKPDVYTGPFFFKGKNITLISTNPTNPDVVAATVLDGGGLGAVVTFDGSEDESCVLDGFTITGGNNTTFGGGVFGNGCLATLKNCVIEGNHVVGASGGGVWGMNGLIENCVIRDNSAASGSGLTKCNGIIKNCLIVNNLGGTLRKCSGTFVNCTIVGQSEDMVATLKACNGVFENCIMQPGAGDLFINSSATTRYCCYPSAVGEEDIDIDPLFVNAAEGNYHLLPNSQCIDAGDPASDYSNEPSPNGDRVNMGAYGNTPEATRSRDGLIMLGFEVVSKVRVGRTAFEYELSMIMRNTNDYDVSDLQMRLIAADDAVLSVADDEVLIGEIMAGEVKISVDTFKLTIDRSSAIDTDRLTWELIYYVPVLGSQSQQSMAIISLAAVDPKPGDITGEGDINLRDFAVLASQWQQLPGVPSADIALPLDGYVGIEDLLYLAEHWLGGLE